MENWKDIKGYEGFYQVSDLGRVKSLERDVYCQNGIVRHIEEKILVPNLNNKGYQYVGLSKNGKRKGMLVHRLVALAFIPNLENKSQINHKNEIKNDNVVENLEWCTASYNNHYGTRTARAVQNHKYPKLGNHPKAKAVFCEELNKKFDSIRRAEEELGICRMSIGKACRGERNTAGKFHWKYADD